jgi:hypothetical protein
MRISLARRNFDKLNNVLSNEDLQVLDALVEYKLTGDWEVLTKQLPVKPKTIYKVFNFLDEYFKDFVAKVVEYELSHYVYVDRADKMAAASDLGSLLGAYRSKTEVGISERFINAVKYLFLFVKEKNAEKLKLSLNSILTKKLRFDNLLRCVVSGIFFSIVTGTPKLDLEKVMETKRMWFLFMH